MKKISRRSFIKGVGAASASAAVAATGLNIGASAAEGENSPKEMEYRTASCGDKVSLLGYGCMRMPTIGNKRGADVDEQAWFRLVDYAIEHGVNYFDTSPVYTGGLNEMYTGRALSRHPRDKYFIATKLSNAWGEHTAAAGKKMYYNSFKQLQVDYIDYYLLHSIGGDIASFNERYVDNGLMDFLMKERQAGRIRNLGFSFHGVVEAFDYFMTLHEKYHWDFVQIQLNYIDWNHAGIGRNVNASYLYEELSKRGIQMTIMEPLRGGALSNVPKVVAEQMLSRRPQDSVASWAFRFAGSYPMVLSVLSGMTYMEHLQDNLNTYCGFEPCSEEEKEFLEKIAIQMDEYPLINCTTCAYCMPCPYGVDIPETFAHYNKCVNEGLMPLSSQDENYRKLRRAFLVGYDRSVPALRQASRCIGCKECVPKCPQRLRIPALMRQIDDFCETLKQGKEF